MPIMDAIACWDIFLSNELVCINRVRKYKGLYSLADLILFDGWTIDPWALYNNSSRIKWNFPVERPLHLDFILFGQFITLLSSMIHQLPQTFRQFILQPHLCNKLFVNKNKPEVYHVTNKNPS